MEEASRSSRLLLDLLCRKLSTIIGISNANLTKNEVPFKETPAPEEKSIEKATATMSKAQALRVSMLHSIAKRFSLSNSEISMLMSQKIRTCDDLISTDDATIHAMYTKKKAFMADRILEAKKRIHAEITQLEEAENL